LLKAVAAALAEGHVECQWNTVVTDDSLPKADVVVDCGGMGARRDWLHLRDVRGEIVRLNAPEIDLHHMLRLLHPSGTFYVVPRDEGRLVVGATNIESDDRSTVSVRGAPELLSSACSMLPAMAEARILEFATQVRPGTSRESAHVSLRERTENIANQWTLTSWVSIVPNGCRGGIGLVVRSSNLSVCRTMALFACRRFGSFY
jgi:glycine oxidase